MIDWLESERKFFSARYYRQHCTFRHGAFIKDLSSVEPDLSKVMILDNSPLSYMFHQGQSSLEPQVVGNWSRSRSWAPLSTKIGNADAQEQTMRFQYKAG